MPSLLYRVRVVASSTNAVVPTTVIDSSSSVPMPSSPRDDFSTVLPSSPGPYERSTPSSAETVYTVPSTPTATFAFLPSSATGSAPCAPMPLTAVNGLAHRVPDGSSTATVDEPIATDEPGASEAESDRMTRAGSTAAIDEPTVSTIITRDPLCKMS